MENEFDYYLPFPIIGSSTPTLIVNPDSDLDVDLDLEMPYPLNEISLIEFEFRTPYPKKPNMVDYLVHGGWGIVSEKIYQALSPLNVKGIQLIPATIANPKNKDIYDHYYFLHIYNYLECLDTEKSVYTKDVLDMVEMIQKIILDEKVLSKIPLEDRLVFRLGELFCQAIF
ncbi:hypothetical protein AGMMS50293_30780 [Spirochaetia bacterium]|nr:hypothetical protein AGMMS50293_30780 [Spirochaetia bacterium]